MNLLNLQSTKDTKITNKAMQLFRVFRGHLFFLE
jgi:hypothetical protein